MGARERTSSTRRLAPGRQSVGERRAARRATTTTRSSPCAGRRRPRRTARPTASASSTPATSSPRPRSTRSTRPGSGSASSPTRSPGRLEPGASFATPEAILVYSDAGLGGAERRVPRPLPRAAGARHVARPAAAGPHQQLGGDLLRLRRDEAASRSRPPRATSASSCSSSTTAGSASATTTPPRSATGSSTGASCPTASTAWRRTDRGARHQVRAVDRARDGQRARAELFEAHPDWAIGVPGRPRTESRQQLVLDMSRPEVVDHLFDVLSEVLASAPISYVKWDMNRNITEPFSVALPADRQGEFFHRYILGVYDLYAPADDAPSPRSCSSRARAAAAGSTPGCWRSRRRPGRATTPTPSSGCGSSGGPRWPTR